MFHTNWAEVFCVEQLSMLSILDSADPCISQVLLADPIPLHVFSYSFCSNN